MRRVTRLTVMTMLIVSARRVAGRDRRPRPLHHHVRHAIACTSRTRRSARLRRHSQRCTQSARTYERTHAPTHTHALTLARTRYTHDARLHAHTHVRT
eukprot:3204572-Pleurochrysis_carterae.AAC.1